MMRIAVVRARCGYTTCVGPNDYKQGDYSDAMDAAISYGLEAGYLPAHCLWVDVDLPAMPNEQTEKGSATEIPIPEKWAAVE